MYNQWLPSSKDSTFMIIKKQRQQKTDTKSLTVRHFFHVQIHCACQWIMTLPPKILWPTALLNTWNIITFPKSSFYHTNHTFLTNINVWMMDFWSINTRIKKKSSAQNTILCREWLLQKLAFRHSEIKKFNHSQYPTQRTFGEPPAPSVCIYVIIHVMQFIWGPKFSDVDMCFSVTRMPIEVFDSNPRNCFFPSVSSCCSDSLFSECHCVILGFLLPNIITSRCFKPKEIGITFKSLLFTNSFQHKYSDPNTAVIYIYIYVLYI